MYSYISLGVEHVGPKTHDNYLVVFDMTSRIEFTNAIKSFFKHLLVYGLVGGIAVLIIHFI